MQRYKEPPEKQIEAYFEALRKPQQKEKLKRFNFFLPPSLVEELQRQGHNKCMSGSQLLRNILTKHLEEG